MAQMGTGQHTKYSPNFPECITHVISQNEMSVSNDEIKTVAKDWLAEFPDLTLYLPYKLYRITGPLIMGLELTKLPGGR